MRTDLPDKIYVHRTIHLGMLSATELQIGTKDEQEYIRKDALLEWAESEREKCADETHPYAMFMNVVIDKINSL